MDLSDSLEGSSMNSSDWMSNSTTSALQLPVILPVGSSHGLDNMLDTTESSPLLISNKPCGEALSSQTPAAVKLPGSLDALLYIVIVLMFYAFSIAVLMVKYIRREREEANLRNYYHEFVSRDKFRSAQYKNKQFMKRIFGKSSQREDHSLSAVEEEAWDTPRLMRATGKHKNQAQTISQSGHTFSRLIVDNFEEKPGKESFTFLGAKNQFCKNMFFGKKFCNKQLCSKCVSESVPTIDWGDDRASCASGSKQEHGWNNTVEVRLLTSEERALPEGHSYHKNYNNDFKECNYMFDRVDSIFLPIIECDSDKENEDAGKVQFMPTKRNSEDVLLHTNYKTAVDEPALVSSCSLEVSELLANMPPLGAANASKSNDMDTLDGLSNLDSEAESQSLLNYSASMKGTNSCAGGQKRGSPGFRNKSASGDDRLKDLSDFLSERTSLLSCTLSIDDGEDEDIVTNLSSKHHPNGISLSNSNGRMKEDFKSNGKSILNSLSKSVSSDEEEVIKILSDITMLTEESGVFRNLKYFLRSFSKHEEIEDVHEKSNLLPRETYFGPGSPKSFYSESQIAVVSTKCDPVNQNCLCSDMDDIDHDLLNQEECEDYGNRWGYTYDEEDDIYSEGDKSSSFGEYCMGETSGSQIIDISKPLIRRQLDSVTKDGLSRAFIGLTDPWTEDFPPLNKPNPMLAGYGSARKETKV